MKKFLALISCSSSKKENKELKKRRNSCSFELSNNTNNSSQSEQSFTIEPFKTPQLKPSKFASDEMRNRIVFFQPLTQKSKSAELKDNRSEFEKSLIEGPDSLELNDLISEIILLNHDERITLEISLLNTIKEFKCKTFHLVSAVWMDSYISYLKGETQAVPKEIDNFQLVNGIITSDQKMYRVSTLIWNFLAALYEGGPALPDFDRIGERRDFNLLARSRPSTKAFLESSVFSMAKELKELESLEGGKRKACLEKKFYDEHFAEKTETQFIVDKKWMSSYRKYLKGEIEFPNLNINHEEILKSIENLAFLAHYELVNDYVWQFIAKVHKFPDTLAAKRTNSAQNQVNFLNFDAILKEITTEEILTAASHVIVPGRLSDQAQNMFLTHVSQS